MSDIVQKLRDIQAGDSAWSSPVVCEEAADEIERLRLVLDAQRETEIAMRKGADKATEEIERLRGLLNEIEAITRAPEVNPEEVRKAMGLTT